MTPVSHGCKKFHAFFVHLIHRRDLAVSETQWRQVWVQDSLESTSETFYRCYRFLQYQRV